MNLIDGLIDQCRVLPNQPALIQDEKTLYYRDLEKQLHRIVLALNNHPVSCQRVAIALERGIDAVIAILGSLYAGACYIPLDLKNPPERLNYIIADADVQCIIGQGESPPWVDDPSLWLDISGLTGSPAAMQTAQVVPESLAAILYTSGSTGKPKGVALSHRALLSFSQWAANTFKVKSMDRVASLAPFHFDLSIFDLFTSLSVGASINFIPERLSLSPSRLSKWLSNNEISIWYTVPSILSFIAFKGALDVTPLTHLKTILFAGEVFPTPHLIRLIKLLPETTLYNLYGPTETNVCCYWPVDKTRLQTDHTIPIGMAACDAALKINDATGELSVKGANNLSGYWQQGRLHPTIIKNGWYATGDKVSINESGEFCYHGRLDRMMKYSGYRVEPAEIEAALNQLPGVKQCAVIGIKDVRSGQRPVAAVVLQDNSELGDLVKPLRQKLPTYMLPRTFVEITALPYLSNGKVDYLALEKMLK